MFEVLRIFPVCVLPLKIIHKEGEEDIGSLVCNQNFLDVFLAVVCIFHCLIQARHSLLNYDIYRAFVINDKQLIFVNDFLRY